jgi:antitoxin (DNA-binding transcriptional repressor) of toxin-antitoxin stability system
MAVTYKTELPLRRIALYVLPSRKLVSGFRDSTLENSLVIDGSLVGHWSLQMNLDCLHAHFEHIVHRVRAGGSIRKKLRGHQRSAGIAVARVSPVREFQRFAERAEDDGVLADIIADADGMDADLWRMAFDMLA